MSDKGTPERAIEDRRIRTGVLLERELRGVLTEAEALELTKLEGIARREAASIEGVQPDDEQARQLNADAEAISKGVGSGLLASLGAWFKSLVGL